MNHMNITHFNDERMNIMSVLSPLVITVISEISKSGFITTKMTIFNWVQKKWIRNQTTRTIKT